MRRQALRAPSASRSAQAGRRGLLLIVAVLVAVLAWDTYKAMVEPDSKGTPAVTIPAESVPSGPTATQSTQPAPSP